MPEKILRNFLAEQLKAGDTVVQRLVVGFSGGLDSTVLLQGLAKLAPSFGVPVLAVHVHHGLSQHADNWAAHACQVTANLHIPIQVIRVTLPAMASLEAAARQARYQAFAKYLQAGDALLLAQHQNDQAETFLLRLWRGSGVTGLTAIRPVDRFPLPLPFPVPLWRPLLSCSRQQLSNYAHHHALTWVEDESNQDESLNRNFLRQRVLPLLKSRWPALTGTLAATAERMQEAGSLLDEMAETLLQSVQVENSSLDLLRLQQITQGKNAEAKQRLLLRHWLGRSMPQLPDSHVLEVLRTQMLSANEDANPVVCLGDWEVRRYRQHAFLLPAVAPVSQDWQADWSPEQALPLPDGCLLRAEGEALATLPRLWVGYRRGGEKLFYRQQHRELKKLFQETGVPPWERERLPLVWLGNELLAVAGTALLSDNSQGITFYLETPAKLLEDTFVQGRDNLADDRGTS